MCKRDLPALYVNVFVFVVLQPGTKKGNTYTYTYTYSNYRRWLVACFKMYPVLISKCINLVADTGNMLPNCKLNYHT